MPIHSRKNLYPGINLHLNSYLQGEPGGWQSFHAEHIVDLARTIRHALPPGYFTRSERSLQIASYDAATGTESRSSTVPDVLVLRSRSAQSQPPSAVADAAQPGMTLALPALFEDDEDEDTLNGLVIYQVVAGKLPGKPVTRVELLSPGNKPGHAHYAYYMSKRRLVLESDLRLVELDYLNQTPPLSPVLPTYPAEGAAPFSILVSDPRPSYDAGTTAIYPIGVHETLPTINIPLEGADLVQVDFAAAYNTTYEALDYLDDIVDYAAEPVALDSYSPADQQRIRDLLAMIRAQDTGEQTE